MNTGPRIRPGLRFREQSGAREATVHVYEPESGRTVRMTSAEAHLLRQMDGTRGSEQLAARLALDGRHCPPGAVRQFVERCASAGLLVGEQPTPPTRSWLLRLFYFRIPLVDPDRHLGGFAAAWRFLTSGFMLWPIAVLLASGAWIVIHELPTIARSGLDQLTPANIPWLLASVLVVKVLHELGHAAAAKRHGCPVHDAGVAFLCLLPCLYVDTSHAWQLGERGRRAEIAAAGIAVELAVAAIAAHVWHGTSAGTTNAIAFHLMTASLVMSLVLNANPLMRFDGYFVLCDLLGQPNLGSRSSAVLRYYLFHRWLGVRQVIDPSTSSTERRWLAVYGISSAVWRVLLAWFIAHAIYARFFPALGAALGALALWQFLLAPLGKTAAEVVRARRWLRPRIAPTIVAVAIAAGSVAFVALPVDSHDVFPCVVVPQRSELIIASGEGRVQQRLIELGDVVEPGQTLFVLDPDELEHAQRLAEVDLRIAEHRHDTARSNEQEWRRAAVTAPGVVAAEQRLARVHEDLERTRTTALEGGLVVELDDRCDPGSVIRRGQVLGRIAVGGRARALAYLREQDLDALEPGMPIAVSIATAPYRIDGHVVRVGRESVDDLTANPLAAHLGGPIPTRAEDGARTVPRNPMFEVEVELSTLELPLGITGRIEVELARAPLFVKAWRSLADAMRREVLL